MNGYFKWLVRHCCDGLSHVLKGDLDLQQSKEKDVMSSNLNVEGFGSCLTTTVGGTRAGLFRTPISGGVQSATSAHGLPRPALAVRNLMEQVILLCFKDIQIQIFFKLPKLPKNSL